MLLLCGRASSNKNAEQSAQGRALWKGESVGKERCLTLDNPPEKSPCPSHVASSPDPRAGLSLDLCCPYIMQPGQAALFFQHEETPQESSNTSKNQALDTFITTEGRAPNLQSHRPAIK